MARDRRAVIGSFDDPTWVYYAYCSHGGLLYVGVARDVARRVRRHRRDKPWWDREVDWMFATLYPTRQQARAVEVHEILTHRPAHNIVGQGPATALPHEVLPYESTQFGVLNARGMAS